MPCVQCSLTNSCQIKLKYPAASVFLACDCNNCNCNSSNHCRKLAVANQLGTSTFFLFEFLSGLPAIVGLSADFLSPRQVYSPPWTECLSSPPPNRLQSVRPAAGGAGCSRSGLLSKEARLLALYTALHQTIMDVQWAFACARHITDTACLSTGCATWGKSSVLSKPASSCAEWRQSEQSVSHGCSRAIKEITRVRHLAQHLARSQHSSNVSYISSSAVSVHDFI